MDRFSSSKVRLNAGSAAISSRQIVVLTLFFDIAACFHGKLTDALMQLLTVAACLYRIHHDVLGRHERQLCHQMLLDDLRIYHQSVYYIQVQIQDAIDRQEALRNATDACWRSRPAYAQTTGWRR